MSKVPNTHTAQTVAEVVHVANTIPPHYGQHTGTSAPVGSYVAHAPTGSEVVPVLTDAQVVPVPT